MLRSTFVSEASVDAQAMSMHWHIQAMAGTSSGSRLRQQQEVPFGHLQSTGQVR